MNKYNSQIMKREIIVPKVIEYFNILLVDDTWHNMTALQNNLKKIKIHNVEIVIKTCTDGEKAV